MSQHYRLAAIAVAATALAATAVQAADNFPSRPMQMIIPFSAGGPTDIVGRIMGAKMGEILGQQFVVENKTGAGGNIGADSVAKADARRLHDADGDGVHQRHQSGPVQAHALRRGTRISRRSARVGVTPTLLLAHPSFPSPMSKASSRCIKANPNKYNYGSSGLGSILHLCGEEFKAMAGGLDITHVPYKGSAPMDTDLLGGQIVMAFDATPTALPLAQSGKLHALGAGMLKRLAALPDLPTLDEQGLKGYECYTWNAILAPAGTPKPIVDKLNDAINKALADPAVSSALEKAGIDPTPGSTPETTADFVKAELAKWAPIIKASGAQVD